MHDFHEWSRIAFRRQHGLLDLPEPCRPVLTPDDAMFRLACRHRVAGLWAAELVPAWKHYAYGQAQHAVRCALEAERIYGHLRQSIPGIAIVKGPALAVQAWPQPGLRHFDDLDFRCGKTEYCRLRDAFGSLGYRPAIEDAGRHENLWSFGWGVSFSRADGFLVECNHRMFPTHYPWPPRLDRTGAGLWCLLALDRHDVLTLAPAPHLLYCCLHAVWHGWERLSWAVDIAGLLVRHPEALAAARMLAKAGFPLRSLEHACGVANGLFGPLPGFPAGSSAQDEELREVESLLMRQVAAGGFRVARRLHHGLLNRRERLGYTLRRILIPGDPDFQRWSLPAACRHGYWVLRPLRLLASRLSITA